MGLLGTPSPHGPFGKPVPQIQLGPGGIGAPAGASSLMGSIPPPGAPADRGPFGAPVPPPAFGAAVPLSMSLSGTGATPTTDADRWAGVTQWAGRVVVVLLLLAAVYGGWVWLGGDSTEIESLKELPPAVVPRPGSLTPPTPAPTAAPTDQSSPSGSSGGGGASPDVSASPTIQPPSPVDTPSQGSIPQPPPSPPPTAPPPPPTYPPPPPTAPPTTRPVVPPGVIAFAEALQGATLAHNQIVDLFASTTADPEVSLLPADPSTVAQIEALLAELQGHIDTMRSANPPDPGISAQIVASLDVMQASEQRALQIRTNPSWPTLVLVDRYNDEIDTINAEVDKLGTEDSPGLVDEWIAWADEQYGN